MSDAGLLTTAVFNPALLRKEDLIRGFVARQDLLERLLDDLRRVKPGAVPQHQLVIGQRGLGKTTLLRRLAFAIEDDPKLSVIWMPLVFPEEQYNVKNLGDFWLNCADALSDALDRTGDEAAAEALDKRVEGVPVDPERRSGAALAVLMEAAERLGRGLVLLVDNLDIVLDRLDEKEEWEFRRIISAEPHLYFIGASSRALEALYEHGRAFYDYFQVHDLKGLDDEQTFALLGRLAAEAQDERVQKLLDENPARVRALRVLTGGNPRTLVLLFRVLQEGPEGDVQRDVEQLLDLYTPLYKARFEEMAAQAQQVVDAVAIHWDPVTAADLAEKLAPLTVSQVSAQLNRLEDFGVVEKAEWFGEKKAAFQISERFFNIWYLMRASRRVRRRLVWLVKFLEAWFERDELKERARAYLERDPGLIGPEKFAEMTLAYSQAVDDPYLRRSLESAGLQAALDCSVRDLIDFSDLPPELQDRKARMEKLRHLRDRVLAMKLEGVDSAELWRVLGGSPHLTLEEKSKIVKILTVLDEVDGRGLYENLQQLENSLGAQYPAHSKAVARLYEAVAAGEIADVLDVDATLSVAKRWGCADLPALAILSRFAVLRSPKAPKELEFERVEAALRRLTTEAEFERDAWIALSVYFEGRNLDVRLLDAYVEAMEQNPNNVLAKASLLAYVQSARAVKHLPDALLAVSRVHKAAPESTPIEFALAGLLALSSRWDEAVGHLEALAGSEIDKPDVWTFGAVVRAGHAADAVALLERTGADQRWRPLYEALRAVRAGSADYLRRVAPEVRTVAGEILKEIAPELGKGKKLSRGK